MGFAVPIILAALGTAEAISGAVVFVEFIKEEAIQTVSMAAYQAVRFNQKAKAKYLYERIRDYYALDLAKTVAKVDDYDPDLVSWAGWTSWNAYEFLDIATYLPPPYNIIVGGWSNFNWGMLAPYTRQAFINFVNASLLQAKTMLETL